MRKRISKKGYRILAVIWTLAAASVAVALVRWLPKLNLLLLALLILSVVLAGSYWKTYHRTPEEGGMDPFPAPPKFADDPVLFDDDPPGRGINSTNQDSEENDK